ncbi:MAG: RNA methyltransferase [Erysipelotrichaceae bacterium]|nr:RNA methyltransferase [Erysipelotrichaceae bacterium]
MLITSVHNEHIKELTRLKEKKYRDQSNTFLVETKHLVLEAFKAGLIKELILEQNEIFPLDVPTLYVSKEVLKKLSSMDSPSRVMAVVNKRKDEEKFGEKILILDRIQDPGNLGTIIRSAVAFNIDTIVCSPDTVDFYSPKVVRASQGMMFHIPILVKNTEKLIHELKNQDYKIVGTKVTNGHDVREASIYSHFALVIGNEGQGISRNIEELCDEYLYIKMNENCESLNASVAASILLYEINNK